MSYTVRSIIGIGGKGRLSRENNVLHVFIPDLDTEPIQFDFAHLSESILNGYPDNLGPFNVYTKKDIVTIELGKHEIRVFKEHFLGLIE